MMVFGSHHNMHGIMKRCKVIRLVRHGARRSIFHSLPSCGRVYRNRSCNLDGCPAQNSTSLRVTIISVLLYHSPFPPPQKSRTHNGTILHPPQCSGTSTSPPSNLSCISLNLAPTVSSPTTRLCSLAQAPSWLPRGLVLK